MTKEYGMKKKGRFKRHFKRHWKKYAAGAGLAGGGAGLLSGRAIMGTFKLAGKAQAKGWGKTSTALRKTGMGLAWLRNPVKNFKMSREVRRYRKNAKVLGI